MNPMEPLRALVGRAEPTELLVVGSYAVILVLLAVDLTRSSDVARRPSARRAASLAVTAGGSLAVAPVTAALLAGVWSAASRVAPDVLRQLWASRPLLASLACFVVVDGAAWAYHWIGHHTAVGWASHRVHHLGERYDATLVLRQPWFPVHSLAVLPLVALLGFPFALAAGCWTLSLTYQATQHTTRCWSLGRTEGVLVSAAAHRHHHLVSGGAVNLGAVLTIWDRLAGTRRTGEPLEGAVTGNGDREPLNPFLIQLEGWRGLVAGRSRRAERGAGRSSRRGRRDEPLAPKAFSEEGSVPIPQ